jgi:hypothetical protein
MRIGERGVRPGAAAIIAAILEKFKISPVQIVNIISFCLISSFKIVAGKLTPYPGIPKPVRGRGFVQEELC